MREFILCGDSLLSFISGPFGTIGLFLVVAFFAMAGAVIIRGIEILIKGRMD